MDWINKLSENEKKLLKLGSLIVFVTLLWAFVYKPITKSIESDMRLKNQLVAQLSEMESAANEMSVQSSSKPTVIILGYTKTGKYPIAKKLAEELNRPLFVSDDYGYQDSADKGLYKFMDAIMPLYLEETPMIIEGVLCFRLLRKGLQLQNFFADLIIKTECSDDTISYFYKKDGESNKIDRALAFNKGLNTIWEEYLTMIYKNPSIKRPNYIELETSLK